MLVLSLLLSFTPGIDYHMDGRITLPDHPNSQITEISVSPVAPGGQIKLELSLGPTPDRRTLRFFVDDKLQHIISNIPQHVKFAVLFCLSFFTRFCCIQLSPFSLSLSLYLYLLSSTFTRFPVHIKFKQHSQSNRHYSVHLLRD